MKKKIFTITSVLLLLIAVIIILNYSLLNNTDLEVALNSNAEKEETLKIIPVDETVDESKIALNTLTSASYLVDFSDNQVISDLAELIIIGTVESIDGVINYNPVDKQYVMARTTGRIKVNNVLKGDLNKDEIFFMRLGGTLPLSEYEKSLPEKHIEKMGFNKLTQNEKDAIYVSEMMSDDIKIEKGKTYLMYLNYAIDYDKYSIRFVEYGLRELETDKSTINISNVQTLNTHEYSTIKVKNNKTGEYETLDSILPETIKNSNNTEEK